MLGPFRALFSSLLVHSPTHYLFSPHVPVISSAGVSEAPYGSGKYLQNPANRIIPMLCNILISNHVSWGDGS
jgi:hypothetical protein